MNFNCNVALPYPEICVEEENPYYVNLLMPLYSGVSGKLTILLNYVYQSFILESENTRLADIFECISRTEMLHFRMLGKTIKALGGDPKLKIQYSRNRYRWWSGDLLNYDNNINNIIRNNIALEQESIYEYTNIIQRISDRCIIAMLERFRIDEEHHIDILQSLLI